MIVISTSNFKKACHNDLKQIIAYLPESFSVYEIASNHQSDFSDLQRLKKIKAERHVKFLLHNYPFREPYSLMIDLANENPKKRQQVLDYLKQMVEFSAELGSDYFSFHAGYTSNSNDPNIVQKSMDLFIESLYWLNEFSKKHGVKIGVENHSAELKERDSMFLCNAKDFEYLFNAIDDENLCLHLDLGHLKIAANAYDFSIRTFIQHFKDKIVAVHLSDNDGVNDLHSAIHKQTDFLKELSILSTVKYFILESWDQAIESLSVQADLLTTQCGFNV